MPKCKQISVGRAGDVRYTTDQPKYILIRCFIRVRNYCTGIYPQTANALILADDDDDDNDDDDDENDDDDAFVFSVPFNITIDSRYLDLAYLE